MKYYLGDRVRYKSKRPVYDFTGTVIGMDPSNTLYFIEPDTPQVSKGYVFFDKSWIPQSYHRLNEYFENGQSKKDCVCFASDVKGLSLDVYVYVPTNEGDKEGDI